LCSLHNFKHNLNSIHKQAIILCFFARMFKLLGTQRQAEHTDMMDSISSSILIKSEK
jgi:hypothetical protein